MTPKSPPKMAATVEPSQANVEIVAQAIHDIKGGLNYDYMDFCRDAARAAIVSCQRLAQQSAATGGEVPSGWMRRWAFDKNEGTKGDRPKGWKLHAITSIKCLDDDVPLFTHPNDMARENEGPEAYLGNATTQQIVDELIVRREMDHLHPDYCTTMRGADYDALSDIRINLPGLFGITASNPPAPSAVMVGACKHERLGAMATTGYMSCIDCRWMRPMTPEEFAHWNPPFKERSK